MALPNTSFASFIVGVLILAYLSTFVVFAVIRVLFGVSIQRLWWSGLRRIAFAPREGIRVDIRGLRLSLHRPTFAQPTWLSIVVTELKISLDLKALGTKSVKKSRWAHFRSSSLARLASPSLPSSPSRSPPSPQSEDETDLDDSEPERSRTWERLTLIKEKIKRLHRQINWLRLVDVVALNSSLAIQEVGAVEVAMFTMAVDTRPKTVDRSRLFQHRRAQSTGQRPAEWIFTLRSLLFSPEGQDSSEILDHATLNVHGLLYQELEGLRDASIALKLGRVSLPYDDLSASMKKIRSHRHAPLRGGSSVDKETSLSDIMEELDKPGSKEESIVQSVSDSKEFAASILRGIQEIQFAVSFVGLTKRMDSLQASKSPVYLNASMKEVGIDLLRLDSSSPAHLMYFNRNDVAHQALLTAISISVGIDDGQEHPERLLYIPMATATVKSTLPSKTIQFSRQKNVAERNTNMLFANLVITSPSVDLDPKHLPLVLILLRNRKARLQPPRHQRAKHHLISRLLPKASIKCAIHEPVVRVALPCMEPERRGTGEYDLLISATSNMALDVESSHSAGGELHYSLASNFRVTAHQLYYQTASAEKHNLLLTDSLEMKLQISASPDLAVVATVNAQTFSVYMVRPEISEGVRQIVSQLRSDALGSTQSHSRGDRPNFLRRLPAWLLHVNFQGSDFNFEVAGIDSEVSQHARGTSFHLESWTAEYKANRHDELGHRPHRRRAMSRSAQADEIFLKPLSPSPSRKPHGSESDGRRLAIHTRGLEAFVIESPDTLEPEAFASLPRFEVAFTTSTDQQGPVLHINSFAKALYMQYSLQRHFAIGVATMVLRKTFATPPSAPSTPTTPTSQSRLPPAFSDAIPSPGLKTEIVSIDLRVGLVQLKATMPADPPLMLQIFAVEVGRHRWASPFAKARLSRLYAEAPGMRKVWARIASVRNMRVDYRHSRKKYGTTFVEERSIDIASDAIRLAVPHQLVVHKIFDNATNVVKTLDQLHYRFKTGTDDYILAKKPQGPKKVPKISLRTQAFLFEIEDGSFEWKLGTIYLQGLQEQKQRLAREEAFRLKVKKIEEAELRRGPAFRSKPTFFSRGRHKRRSSEDIPLGPRSKSEDPPPKRGRSPGSRRVRYDAEGTCGLSDSARRSIDDAREKLHLFNAESWRRRITAAYDFQTHTMRDIRSIVWGMDDMPEEAEQHERILAIPQRPALMAVTISDLNINIDKPSFPIMDYPSFLHRIGKGMPYDMQYSLLIPMHVKIGMGETRMTLRDYPLPLLHVPAIRAGQSPRLPSLSMETDFVIAEEFRDGESIRHVRVTVVPPEKDANSAPKGGLTVDVRRTVAAVKMYSELAVEINTSLPTRITWGTSYQPAIQDMMQVVENFTKPAVDPSERVGFWDKIRLSFHSRVNVAWKGDGDVHLILKGSRDPYHCTGSGAGFVMCWRNDVRWNICQVDDPKKFMTVDSGEYVLAVPDFSQYARRALERDTSETSSVTSTGSYELGGKFKKTVMKLSGNVRWLAGLVFERNTEEGGRSFDFIPHYNVVLKSPDFAKPHNGLPYDAFRGFRSQHIHLSVAVAAPVDRDWTVTNLKPSSNYNSVHLSPRSFSHFFDWWSMFSGNMSLPIRQGKLWPGVDKSSKKFGRHLATIKYNLLLSPLYLSHIYKHKDPEDYGQNVLSATGVKVKLDSFMLDLHQRREVFRQQIQGNRQSKTTAMRINQAQLDFIHADFRAVSQIIKGTTSDDIDGADDETLASYEQTVPAADLSCFTIPDNDTDWVDMDDFVELDWILPAESNPQTEILPLACAPRFTYFRQTDHHNVISGDPMRSSAFGNEDTHYCVMSARNDPRRVQCDLIQERLDRLVEQISQNKRTIGEQELKVIRGPAGQGRAEAKLQAFREHHEVLMKKQKFLQAMHKVLIARLGDNDSHGSLNADVPHEVDEFFEAHEEYDPTDPEVLGMYSAPLAEDISDFNNRFIVHNVQFKWNNSLRNVILRYIHQVSQRRGFVYYMSRRAVKFILDIVEEQQNKARADHGKSEQTPADPLRRPSIVRTKTGDEEEDIQDRIQQIIEDGRRFVEADDSADASEQPKTGANAASEEISREFTAQNAYHFRLVAPQIQLQSSNNTKGAALITAKGMQLKVIQIMDKDRVTDDVSGLVQRRFTAAMDSVQIFVTSSKTFSSEFLGLYSANRYGAKTGSSWPPWVPLEVMFDFNVDPYGFSRVVQRTSVSMRFDKFNTLRLKYNDDVTSGQANGSPGDVGGDENRMDHLWVEFPRLLAKCDSTQYYTLYLIVLDLLLFSEPLEKTRSERLEKIMLASDFSDLSGAPETVTKLQEKIRTLQEIKVLFQINERTLSRQQWKERIALEHDLTACEDELFFIMKAITTSQRKFDERVSSSQATGLLRWEIAASELVWHLMRSAEESLVELQLKNAKFNRIDNNDGSNDNTMEIETIEGWNLLPNAMYPQIIAPFEEKEQAFAEDKNSRMLRISWYMLEAIAGIPVMERFEVSIYPLKIQLEREVGTKVFEYVFPGMSSEDQSGDSSAATAKQALPPHQEEEDEDSGQSTDASSPVVADASGAQTLMGGAGDLSLRLQPTLALPDHRRWGRPKHAQHGSHPDLRRLKHLGTSGPEIKRFTARSRKDTFDNASSFLRPDSSRHNSIASTTNSKKEGDVSKRFTLHRSNSEASKIGGEKGRSDDLTQMLGRASKYMTLAYVRIPSMVLCLSYKGKGQRNIITDVHDLVFRMPALEYRNKTWSNYDLFMQLKKEVVRALISHAGAIVGNKFHRPNKQQQSRLREVANSSVILGSPAGDGSGFASEAQSLQDLSIFDESDSEPRVSFTSGRGSELSSQYPNSMSGSFHSDQSSTNQANGGRPWTSGAVTRTTVTDGTTPAPTASDAGSTAEREHESIRTALSRRLTSISGRAHVHEGSTTSVDDSEDSKRKSKLSLPKFLAPATRDRRGKFES